MKDSGKPLLLLVDDDQIIADTLGFTLGKAFEVISRPTREAAMAAVRELPRPPDAALVDLGLPPIPHRPDEGFALIGELLAIAPDIRIVALPFHDHGKRRPRASWGRLGPTS